jgi:hypothetical protein
MVFLSFMQFLSSACDLRASICSSKLGTHQNGKSTYAKLLYTGRSVWTKFRPETDVPVRTKFEQIFTSSQLPFELLLVLPRINHLCFIISSSFDPQHWRRCQDHNKDSPAVESLEHVPFQRAWKYRCFAMDSVPDQWPFDALQRTLN